MPATMKGQVCVVTGASRGIGRGIALQLCQAGATVYITGCHLDTLQATAQEVSASSGVPGGRNHLRELFPLTTPLNPLPETKIFLNKHEHLF